MPVYGHAGSAIGFGLVGAWAGSVHWGWAGSPRISRCCSIGCPDTASACMYGHSPSYCKKIVKMKFSYMIQEYSHA